MTAAVSGSCISRAILRRASAGQLTATDITALLAAIADRRGVSGTAARKALTAPGVSRIEQFALVKRGLTRQERREVERILDAVGEVLSRNLRNFLEALVARAPLDMRFGPLGEVSKAGPRGHRFDLPDPPTNPDTSLFVEKRRATDAVFDVHSASFRHSQQGAAGDCFLIAPIASAIEANREKLDEVVRQKDPKGRFYVVRLHEADVVDGEAKPRGDGAVENIPVDRDLYVRFGKTLFARTFPGSSPQQRLLTPILEKAFALSAGGYAALASGGKPALVMARLFGEPARALDLSDLERLLAESGATMGGFIEHCFVHRRVPVVLGTPNELPEEAAAHYMPKHCYAVVGFERGEDGVERVTLMEPNRSKEPSGDGERDGVFTLRADELSDIFISVCTLV